MEREQIYNELTRERIYQDLMAKKYDWQGAQRPHAVGTWIVFMDDYLNRAKHALSSTVGDLTALNELRKVVALGIACFEAHGCPVRRESDDWSGTSVKE